MGSNSFHQIDELFTIHEIFRSANVRSIRCSLPIDSSLIDNKTQKNQFQTLGCAVDIDMQTTRLFIDYVILPATVECNDVNDVTPYPIRSLQTFSPSRTSGFESKHILLGLKRCLIFTERHNYRYFAVHPVILSDFKIFQMDRILTWYTTAGSTDSTTITTLMILLFLG